MEIKRSLKKKANRTGEREKKRSTTRPVGERGTDGGMIFKNPHAACLLPCLLFPLFFYFILFFSRKEVRWVC